MYLMHRLHQVNDNCKMRHSPKFIKRYKETRVQWSRNPMNYTDKWLSVVSNMKRNLILVARLVGHIIFTIFARNHQLFSGENKEGFTDGVLIIFYWLNNRYWFLKDHQCSENCQKTIEIHLLLSGKLLCGSKQL